MHLLWVCNINLKTFLCLYIIYLYVFSISTNFKTVGVVYSLVPVHPVTDFLCPVTLFFDCKPAVSFRGILATSSPK